MEQGSDLRNEIVNKGDSNMQKEYDINSFNDYLKILKQYKKEYSEELWLRGQRDHRWKLEPNLYRDKKLDIRGNGIEKLKYKIPDFFEEFEKFVDKVDSDHLFNIEELNKFQIMFLGQHYGLLTPVLDWTTDPLAALFFAIDGYEYDECVYPVIYILRPGFCNSCTDKVWADDSIITEPICIDGANMDCYFEKWLQELENPCSPVPTALCSREEYSFRISRQSGNFTLHSPIQPLNYHWNDIEINKKKLADKLTINPRAVKELALILECLNINQVTLYKIDCETLDDECKKIKSEVYGTFHLFIDSSFGL